MNEQPQQPQAPKQPNPALELPAMKFTQQVKESIQILKDNNNKMAEKLNDVIEEINDIKDFLTYNNKWYRKFYRNKHLKNKFK